MSTAIQRWPRLSFAAVVLAACGAYFLLEVLYILRLPLVMDEFQGAVWVERLRDRLPYRDFLPYKTVLGYYLQLPVLAARGDLWGGLMAVKIEIAAVTAVVIAWAALALQRVLTPRAIGLALFLLLPMSTFLERSAELRVDMWTALAGLVALVFLLRRQWGWAGVWTGIAFLVSQKAAYYLLATEAGFLFLVLLGPGPAAAQRLVAALRPAVVFHLAAAVPVAIYMLFWSLLSSPSAVVEAMFLSHGDIAFQTLYEDIRLQFWHQTLWRNPLFYLLAPLGLLALGRRRRSDDPFAGPAALLLGYGLALLMLGVWHRQPWPYFFVLLIPTIFVLHAAFFDRPLVTLTDRRLRALAAAVYLLLGILYPLTRLDDVFARSNAYQRHMVELGDALLEPGETYLAGFEMLYDREQAVPQLRWLDEHRLAVLGQADDGEVERLREELESRPPKLLIYNYRLTDLPEALEVPLEDNYYPLWGNLFIYAPRLEAGGGEIHLAYGGTYQAMGPAGAAPLDLGGFRLEPGSRENLAAGRYRYNGAGRYRLVLLPEAWLEEMGKGLDPGFREVRPLFPDVYIY